MLRPEKNIHKFLISTPTHMVGEYSSNEILITHSWPDLMTPFQSNILKHRGTLYPTHFVVVFNIDNEKENEDIGRMPNYHFFGDLLTVCMSILYGKLFFHHGMIETNSLFCLPSNIDKSSQMRPSIGPFINKMRCDIPLDLNLEKFELIAPIFTDDLNSKALNILFTSGSFYLRSIQLVDLKPDIAYIDLVTAGEILSNYYNFTEEELFNEQTKRMLEEIQKYNPKPHKVLKIIKSRLYNVRRKYTLTLRKLLNDYFFKNTESSQDNLRLKKDDIEDRIKASYDLRSRYVHTGVDFGKWIFLSNQMGTEIMFGKPAVQDKKYAKILPKSPTYLGLERIIRFCLLRFIHQNLCKIDVNLD